MLLGEVIGQLLEGWYETIEYRVRVDVGPAVVFEDRRERRRQPPILTQLVEAKYARPVVAKDHDGSSGGGKPKSRPPGNLAEVDAILGDFHDVAIEWGRRTHVYAPPEGVYRRNGATEAALAALRHADGLLSPVWSADVCEALRRPLRASRLLLGYDNEWVTIGDTVCGECDGTLIVERGQPREVRCKGCGQSYPWTHWVDMANEGKTIIVPTDDAVAFLAKGGGDNPVRIRQCVNRWAKDGTIKNYGTRKRGGARWSIVELDRAIKAYVAEHQVTPWQRGMSR